MERPVVSLLLAPRPAIKKAAHGSGLDSCASAQPLIVDRGPGRLGLWVRFQKHRHAPCVIYRRNHQRDRGGGVLGRKGSAATAEALGERSD
eukprot:3312325-Prymnesium_polylepis.2